MNIINEIKNSINFIHPKKYKKEWKNQRPLTFKNSIILVSIFAAVAYFLSAISEIVTLSTNTMGIDFFGISQDTMYSALAVEAVGSFVFVILWFVLSQYTTLWIAGFLGGKGTLREQSSFFAKITTAVLVLSAGLSVISIVPCIGTLIAVIGAVLLYLWSLYLIFEAIRYIHKLSVGKAIGLLLLNLIPYLVLQTIIGAIMLAFGPQIEPVDSSKYLEYLEQMQDAQI